MLSRAGLTDRLVQLSLTLYLIYVSPYALNETKIICYEEDEPLNVPGPPLSLYSWNVLGAVRAFLPKGVGYIIASNLAFCKEPDALAKEQAGEAKYEEIPLDKQDSKEVLPNVVVVPLPNLGPLSVESRGYHSGPLSVEPRIPSGPLSVDSRGYPSRSSQHPLPAREQERGPPPVHDQEEGSLPERVQLQRAQSRAGDLQSPRSLCLRDPFLKPLSFRGNRAKFQTPQLLFIDKKTLRSCSLKKTLKSR